MAMIVTIPPAQEPLGLQETKVFLKVDNNDEDNLISDLIKAARINVERLTDKHLISQSWSFYLDAWPATGEFEFPVGPVQSIASITVHGADDVPALIDPSHYLADLKSDPARILLRGSRLWSIPGRPASGIEISAVTGFGPAPSDVPEPFRTVMLQLCADWYENRGGPGLGRPNRGFPSDVIARLHPLRMPHL